MCEICKSYPCHPKCPCYIPPKSKYSCHICKDGILNREEYIVNENNEYAHYECVDYARDLAKFLGYEIKEMKDYNY